MTREEYELKKAEIEKTHYECVAILNQQAAAIHQNRQSEWSHYTRQLMNLNKQFYSDDSHQRS